MNVLGILLQVNAKGTETIGRVQSALSNFTRTISSRIETVSKFNKEISNGDVAIRQWGAALAATVSFGALRKYMADAEKADSTQRKLLQTLARSGQTGYAKALDEQASKLQLVTKFEDDQVAAVQRLLIASGMSAEQTMALTENVLDFAEATGQSAESAAALIARTYRGSEEELGRYNIALGNTGDRARDLQKALAGYAQGQARAAVVEKDAHSAQVRLGETAENLGRTLNASLGPALTILADRAEWWAQWLVKIVEYLRPVLPQIVSLAASFAAVAGTVYLATGAWKVMLSVVNPLRAAFVGLAGVRFSNIQEFTKELGLLQTMKIATWGQRFAAGLSLIAAGFAGWEIGKFINKLQVGGLQIEDWVARAMNWFYRFGQSVGTAGQTAWALLKYTFLEKLTEARLTLLEFVEFAAEKLNSIFPKKLKIPTEGLKGAIAEYRAELGQLKAEEAQAYAEIEAANQRNMADRDYVDSDLVAKGKVAITGGGTSPTVPTGEPAPQATSGLDAALLEKMVALGDRQEAQRVSKLGIDEQIAYVAASQLETERQIAALPKNEDKATLERAVALEDRRLDIVQAREKLEDERAKRSSAAAESTAASALATAEQRIAGIQSNRFMTQERKQAAILPLLEDEKKAIVQLIGYYEQLIASMPADDPRRIDAQDRLEKLRQQQTEVGARQQEATPLSFGQGASTGAVGFLDQIGTSAQIAADGVTASLNTALSSTSDLLYNVISGAATFQDAWNQATLAVGKQFLRMATDMVAKMIWRATVERTLTTLGVALHIGGEQAKTAATNTGFLARIGTKIKEALGDVYQGAIAAFKAMAGIPYVGPFLAAAAMAAAIAGGVALVGKISGHKDGGIIYGPGTGTSDSIVTRLSNGEGVIPARRVQQYGPDFINSIIAGTYLADNATEALSARGSALQAASATPLAAPAPATGATGSTQPQSISLALFDNATSARDYLKSRGGRRMFADRQRRITEDMA